MQLGDEKQIEKQRQMKAIQEKEEAINKLLEPVKKEETGGATCENKKKKKKNKKGKEEKLSTEEIQKEQED